MKSVSSTALRCQSIPRLLAWIRVIRRPYFILSLLAAAFVGPLANGADTYVTTPPPPAAAANASLLNTWLRDQSPIFNAWDMGGQIRARYEIKEDGGSFPNRDFRRTGVDNDNSYFLLREIIHLGYSPSPWFTIFAEARDSSSTGDDRNPNPESDQFDLHQAFIRLGDPAKFPLTAKIGRQELIYGEERLIGTADWGNIPRVFDAAKLRFENPVLWLDAFASRVVLPVDHHFNMPNDYDWFSGLYASSSALIPKQETQLYFLSRNASAQAAAAVPGSLVSLPSARDILTFGLRVRSLPGQWNGWDYAAEIAGQLGSINVSNRRLDHEALAATAGGCYTWAKAFGSPRIGLEYNFASGDHDSTDGKNQTFDNLFPSNHRLYGYMDLISWRNIHNPRLTASIKPIPPLLLTVDYHLFWLADTHDFFYPITGPARGASGPAAPGEPVSYGRNPQFSSFVGSELDLDATYTVNRWANLRIGYGHFFVGDYIRDSLASVGGATDADFLYIQTTFNF